MTSSVAESVLPIVYCRLVIGIVFYMLEYLLLLLQLCHVLLENQ